MPRHLLRHTSQRILKDKSPIIVIPDGIVYDNFDGTNDASLASRIPTKRKVANTWAVPQGAYAINNNVLEARFPSSGQAVATFETAKANVDIRVKGTFPVNGTARTMGITFRYSGNSDRWAFVLSMSASRYRIIEVTGGISTTRAEGTFTFLPNVEYSLKLVVNGDTITGTVDGIGSITYTSAVGNTRTRHGLISNNTVGSDPIKYSSFILNEAPPLADILGTVNPVSFRTAVTQMSMTIVDNNLRTDFSGASSQKTTALTNLAGKFHNLNIFLESFGNGNNTLGAWNGTSDLIADLPQPSLSSLKSHITLLDTAINPTTWGIFGYRIPWQLTGVTSSSGVTTKSTSANYDQDGRRLLTNKTAQFIEWVARWSSELMLFSTKIRTFYLGSEAKGFQSVIPVPNLRAARSQSWDWDDYAGTPGRADMGQFAYYLAYREGIRQGAERAGVDWSEITIVSPYPVISHQGSITENAPNPSGASDAVTFNSRNDWVGSPVDFSDINGSTVYPGYPNRAGAILTAEHVRLLKENEIGADEWDYGIDFGTFNEDGQITPNISDHDLAYYRLVRMMDFSDKLLTKYSFNPSIVKKRLPEYYPKAQYQMDQANEHAIAEALRDDYQSSIDAVFLIGCYEKGVTSPDRWSPYGRGLQSTDSGNQNDPNQWYGGLITRTVTDNNNHSASAVSGGGAAQAGLAIVDNLKTHFPPGTALHAITFSDQSFRGFASPSKAFVVNQTGLTKTFSLNGGTPVSFAPYETKVVSY